MTLFEGKRGRTNLVVSLRAVNGCRRANPAPQLDMLTGTAANQGAWMTAHFQG